jgi:hypothetical protein
MRFFSDWFWAALGGIQVLVMWGTQVSPDQVMSHAAKWAATFGIKEPPNWLKSKETDKVIRHVAASLLLIWGVVTLHQLFDFASMSIGAKVFFWIGVVCFAATLAINFFQPAWLERLAQPLYVIGAGVALAIAGLIWQNWSAPVAPIDVSAITVPLESKITSLTQQLAERTQERDAARVEAAAPKAPTPAQLLEILTPRQNQIDLLTGQLSARTRERDEARQALAARPATPVQPPPPPVLRRSYLGQGAKVRLEDDLDTLSRTFSDDGRSVISNSQQLEHVPADLNRRDSHGLVGGRIWRH